MLRIQYDGAQVETQEDGDGVVDDAANEDEVMIEMKIRQTFSLAASNQA
jgi:hypothetical protein